MEEEFTFGQMAESMMENGKTTTCMVKVSTHGKMVGCTKANMKMIESTGMVPILGMTASNTLDGGKMESNMEKVLIAKTDVIARVSGKTARE